MFPILSVEVTLAYCRRIIFRPIRATHASGIQGLKSVLVLRRQDLDPTGRISTGMYKLFVKYVVFDGIRACLIILIGRISTIFLISPILPTFEPQTIIFALVFVSIRLLYPYQASAR